MEAEAHALPNGTGREMPIYGRVHAMISRNVHTDDVYLANQI